MSIGARSIFFFSSRRRHTRFKCDWSSDVCSSDLFAKRRNGGACPPFTNQVVSERLNPLECWSPFRGLLLPKGSAGLGKNATRIIPVAFLVGAAAVEHDLFTVGADIRTESGEAVRRKATAG